MIKGDNLENQISIQETLGKLPVKERVVISLKTAGFTRGEIGTIIGMTRSAVGIIYKRATNLLRGLL